MKPYGLYDKELDYLDVETITRLGLKSGVGKLKKKSGDFRGYAHGRTKDRVRRSQRRHARREADAQIAEYFNE